MNDKLLQKLQDMVRDDLDQIEKQTILSVEDGFALFGRYHISHTGNGFKVQRADNDIACFDTVRLALSWCIADKCNQWTLADKIKNLDHTRQRLKNDIDISSALTKRMQDQPRRCIAEIKVDHKRSRLRQVNEQLNKCISLAKYWQIKGFQDEIARTRRTNTNTPNRASHAKSSRA